MLSKAWSSATLGIEALLVEIETLIALGMPGYTVVGLPTGAVRESLDRIRAAVQNTGLSFPRGKTTINLAPAEPQVQRYLSKISGPLLDRIDLHIEVTPVSLDELNKRADGEPSADVRARVVEGRRVQAERFAGVPEIYCNAQMGTRLVRRYCTLKEKGQQLMKLAIHRLGLSARAYDRILKVSRTIADLASSASIRPEHLSEAIQYRSLDRDGWIG